MKSIYRLVPGILCLVALFNQSALATVSVNDENDACYHNNFRDALSFGKTMGKLGPYLDKSYNFALQNRPAVPLTPFISGNGLRASAARVASSCVFAHSHLPGLGENLFVGTEPNNQTESNWLINRNFGLVNAVADWVYEARLVNYPSGANVVTCNDGSTGANCRSQIGHYTQIMWDDTTHVGCATQYCPNGVTNFIPGRPSSLVVCHYSPQGNYYDGTNYLAPYVGRGVVSKAANPPAAVDCTLNTPVDPPIEEPDLVIALSYILELLLND